MKIVCGSCQAKYSIADEKVAGKVFRIRCKRCGEVIVVRGDQENAAAAAANGNGQAEQDQAGADAPADAIWHVVINGEQAGPYTPAQLSELIAGGQLDWEAYVWSEGFDNWQPMRDVAELVNAISGQQEEAPAPAPAVAAVPSMGADPFADEAPAPPVVYAKAAGGGGGGVVPTGSMTSGGNSSSSSSTSMSGPTALAGGFDSNPRVVASGPSPRVSAEQAMTGARNENSVLFSLKNLQALATGSMAPAPGPSTRPGYAGGEGSGLIDIRALASTTGVAAEPSKSSEKDALLSLGSAQAGAFGALGSPMLAPPGKADDEGGKKHMMVAIIAGFALLAAAGIGIAFIMKPAVVPPAPVVAPIALPPSAAAPQPSAAPTTPTGAVKPAEPLTEGEIAAAAKPKSADPSQDEPRHRGGSAPKHTAEKPEPAAPAAAKPEPEAKPEKGPKKAPANASIDDLLSGALNGKPGAGSGKSGDSSSAAAANLPEKPTRDDVLAAMKGVTDAVKVCGKGQAGVAFANITVIGKTGKVGNVEVTGITGEAGSCIAKAVRKASFAKFRSDTFQVKFPFRL